MNRKQLFLLTFGIVNLMTVASFNFKLKPALSQLVQSKKVQESQIIAQQTASNAKIFIGGDDESSKYTLTIHSNGRVASLEIPNTEFRKFDSPEIRQKMSKRLYTHFKDEFDAIVFINDKNYYHKTPDDLDISDQFVAASNSIQGIGQGIFKDDKHKYGSEGKLKGTITLNYLIGVENGPFLHEFCHMFGNFIIPKTYIVGVESAGPHWGVSNVGGQLGGFLDKTLRGPFTDKALSTLASGKVGWYQANDGVQKSFEPRSSLNDKPYAPLELYLMGLISEDEAKSMVGTIKVFKGVSIGDDIAEGKFQATDYDTYTIDDIVQTHGKRIPDSTSSQKKFRLLFVVVTSSSRPSLSTKNARGESLLDKVDEQVKEMTKTENTAGTQYNFFRATGGRATMQGDGLFDALK